MSTRLLVPLIFLAAVACQPDPAPPSGADAEADAGVTADGDVSGVDATDADEGDAGETGDADLRDTVDAGETETDTALETDTTLEDATVEDVEDVEEDTTEDAGEDVEDADAALEDADVEDVPDVDDADAEDVPDVDDADVEDVPDVDDADGEDVPDVDDADVEDVPDVDVPDTADVDDADDADVPDTADVDDADDTAMPDDADVDDTDADGGDDAGDTDVEPVEGPREDDPLPDHSPVPHDVFVRVVDTDGTAIEGAHVALDARGVRADVNGDAAFWRLPAGSYRLLVTAPGSPSGFWEVEIPHLYPEEVEIPHLQERRYVVALPTYREMAVFEADEGVVRTVDDTTVSIPAGGLVDLDGNPFTGTVQLAGVPLSAESPESNFAAGTHGTTADGTQVLLAPIGALDLRLVDDDTGLPLQPASGAPIEATFPAPTGAVSGDLFHAWVIDPMAGVWRQDPHAFGVVNEVGLVEVEIPHLSRWAFGPAVPEASTCVRVSLPGIESYADVSLQLTAAGVSRALPVVDATVDLLDVPASGDVLVSAWIGGERVAEARVAVVAQTDGDPASCDEMTAPPSLSMPEPTHAGTGPGRVRALVRASVCPASRVDFELRGPTGVTRDTMAASTLVADGLAPGAWTLAFLDAFDNELGQASITIADCGLAVCPLVDVNIDLGSPLAGDIPGGCGSAPCVGNECYSCVEVRVVNTANAPVSGLSVTVDAPVYASVDTDAGGGVCVEIADNVNTEVLLRAGTGRLAGARLPSNGSCATGGCVVLPLVDGGARSSCGPGMRLLNASASIAGFDDPSYSGQQELRVSDLPSGLSLHVGLDAGILSLILDLDGLNLIAQSAGFRAREQTQTGQERNSAIHLRTKVTPLLGLDVVIGSAESDASGTLDLATAPVELRLLNLSLGSVSTLLSTLGVAQVIGQDDGSVLFRLVGVFVDVALLSIEVEGYVIAHVDTTANTAPLLDNLDAYRLNGAVASVATASTPLGVPDAISGHVSSGESRGALSLCVPVDEPFMMLGEPVAGQLRPFTSLYETGLLGSIGLAGQFSLLSTYVNTDLFWFDRPFVTAIYDAAGVDRLRMHESGTILGRVPSALLGLGFPTTVYLTHPDHGRINPIRLNGDFEVDPSGDYFAFVNLEAEGPGTPYTLRASGGLLDTEFSAFRQRIAPIVGGVAYIH